MVKILEDKLGENLNDLGYGGDFLNTTSKTQYMQQGSDRPNIIKIKNF